MKWILKLFSRSKKPRLYPVADEKNIIYKPKETPIELILSIIAAICFALAIQSCSPTAQLPNGCTYKLNPPKFTK